MTKRLFVGVEVSEEVKIRIAEHSMRLRDRFRSVKVSWEQSEKYHITLKFLGDVNISELEPISEATALIAKNIRPISLKVKGTGGFPESGYSRILWIGIDDKDNALAKIALNFESEFETLGFKREKRSFHPHLTIARIREPRKAAELARAHLNKKIEPVQFIVSKIVIFESQLKPTGSIYIPLKTFTLLP